MNTPNPLRTKILVILLFGFGMISGFSQCKNIRADAKVVRAETNAGGGTSIEVDVKNLDRGKFQISLFGPEKKNEINAEKTRFDNLTQGKYLIVIVAKREEDNFCPKSINVTIN